MSAPLIGIDVGGTNFRIGVVQDMHVVWEQRFQADFAQLCRTQPPGDALDAIRSVLADAIAKARAAYPTAGAAGIGFPGFIEPRSRRVLSSPNLPGLQDADIARALESRCGLPVLLENDASATAWGEFVLCGKPGGDLVYLGLGTGVGGGLVLNGKLRSGAHGVAMEVGHLIVEPNGRPCGCGNRGCLEQYASTSGVVQSYAAQTGATRSAIELAGLAAQGEAAAVRAFALAGEFLAAALAHIAKVVDVGEVVIGGGMSASWPLLQPVFEQRLQYDLIPALRGRLRVRVSEAQDQAGIIGAAMLADEAGREPVAV